jgi:hypothetical protein
MNSEDKFMFSLKRNLAGVLVVKDFVKDAKKARMRLE